MAAPMALRKTTAAKKPHTKIVIARNVETPNSVIQQAAADVNLDCREMTINSHKYEINVQDFQDQVVIGRGQYGVVSRVRHAPSNSIVAIKKIPLTIDKTEAKRAITDVKVSMSAQSPYCVRFYGYLVAEGDIWICMELMDVSLDRLYPPIYKAGHEITEEYLGKIAYSVVSALHYLHKQLGVVHRDVKPSNILANCDGEIKICDYGISGKLQNSLAKTQDVGCKPYMAPERINPEQRSEAGYGVQSDVWSLGITVVEIAIGQHPYPKWQNVFEQLTRVVHGEAPTLPCDKFSPEVCDFVAQCLRKDYYQRPKYDKLLQHPFLVAAETSAVDMRSWLRWALALCGGEVHEFGHAASTTGSVPPPLPPSTSSSSNPHPATSTCSSAANVTAASPAPVAVPRTSAGTAIPSTTTTTTTTTSSSTTAAPLPPTSSSSSTTTTTTTTATATAAETTNGPLCVQLSQTNISFENPSASSSVTSTSTTTAVVAVASTDAVSPSSAEGVSTAT